MHTWEYTHHEEPQGSYVSPHEGVKYRIHSNGGGEPGDIKLIVPPRSIHHYDAVEQFNQPEYYEVEIPFEVIRNFVLEAARSRAIGELEDMEYDQLWQVTGP